jgi:hypothetical protein
MHWYTGSQMRCSSLWWGTVSTFLRHCSINLHGHSKQQIKQFHNHGNLNQRSITTTTNITTNTPLSITNYNSNITNNKANEIITIKVHIPKHGESEIKVMKI